MILPNVEIKKILYATDLSETSIHALAYAVSLANLYGAAITILHVLFEFSNMDARIAPLIGEDEWEKIKKGHYQEVRDKLIGKRRENVAMREVIHSLSEKVKAEAENQDFVTDEIIIESGDPADTIIETAENRNCDLIVMGSHGHGIVEKMLIGSTARKVVRESKKPVLVVRLSE